MSSGSFISLLMAGLDCLFRFASSSDATSNSAMNCSTIRPISARGRSFFFFFLLLKSRSISSSSSASSAYNKNKNFTSCLHKQETNIGSIQYSLITHMKCKACHFLLGRGQGVCFIKKAPLLPETTTPYIFTRVMSLHIRSIVY
jgi:hypothetical protein